MQTADGRCPWFYEGSGGKQKLRADIDNNALTKLITFGFQLVQAGPLQPSLKLVRNLNVVRLVLLTNTLVVLTQRDTTQCDLAVANGSTMGKRSERW